MIIIQSRGGLGNQMFQYAFALATARKLNTLFALDKMDMKDELYFFKGPSTHFFYRFKKLLHPRIYRILLFGIAYSLNLFKKYPDIEFDNWLTPEQNLSQIHPHGYYLGYFQAFAYFKAYQHEVKKAFQLKSQHIQAFRRAYQHLFDHHKIIAVHIRRGDYLDIYNPRLGESNLSLPLEYYHKALQSIENQQDYKVVFVSNEPEFVKKEFGEQDHFIFAKNSALIDFQIIQNADIAIIANSTFAWWAAFLNPKPEKRVVAPRYWLGFKISEEYPKHILQDLDYIQYL